MPALSGHSLPKARNASLQIAGSEHVIEKEPATAGDHLVDPVRRHRLAIVHAQPQLETPGLRVPGPDPDIAVQSPGSVMPDPDDPCPTALAVHGLITQPSLIPGANSRSSGRAAWTPMACGSFRFLVPGFFRTDGVISEIHFVTMSNTGIPES